MSYWSFHYVYAIHRDDTAYILDTFPIVRRKDEQKYNGEYKTKTTILSIYDEMAKSIESGHPYQTSINPPPADPSRAHPDTREVMAKPKLVVVDPAFPKSEVEKVLCAFLLEFVRLQPRLTEDQYIDAVHLAMQPDRCRKFLIGTDRTAFNRSLKTVPPKLVADPTGKPPWRLMLVCLLTNRSLQRDGTLVEPSDNFEQVRKQWLALPAGFVTLVAKAAERLRELQASATPANAEVDQAVHELNVQREATLTL